MTDFFISYTGADKNRLVAALAQESGEGKAARITVEEKLFAEAARLNLAGYPAPLMVWQSHLRTVVEEARPREDEQAARLCNELGFHLQKVGDYAGARPYYERALAILEERLGPEHPWMKIGRDNLAALDAPPGDESPNRPEGRG